jgi:hypothetical protein
MSMHISSPTIVIYEAKKIIRIRNYALKPRELFFEIIYVI